MSDTPADSTTDSPTDAPEVVAPDSSAADPSASEQSAPDQSGADQADAGQSDAGQSVEASEEPPSITEPGKVMRIGSMVKQLLEEVRAADLDEASRERLAEVYERSIVELAGALSPDLQEELRTLSLPFDHEGVPSEAELRVAKAQLVGWLEGLFHGIQASLMAQQFAAQQQLQQLKQIPPGQGQPQPGVTGPPRTGTYL